MTDARNYAKINTLEGFMLEDQQITIFYLLLILGVFFLFTLLKTIIQQISIVRLKLLKQDISAIEKLIDILDESNLFIGLNLVLVSLGGYLLFSFYHWPSFIIYAIILQLLNELAMALALVNPERLFLKLYPLVKFIQFLFGWFAWLLALTQKSFKKLFKSQVDGGMNEQELLNILDEAQSEGSLQETETTLIKRSIEFNDVLVEEILMPRVDMVALDISWPIEKIKQVVFENGYSRYPVYEDSIDQIIGVLHTKDLFGQTTQSKQLNDLIKNVLFVPESYKISKLLKQFQVHKTHLAIVIDEHGGTAGLVTLEDIVEELVGEIWDEHDDVEVDLTRISDHQYIVLGSMDLYELVEQLEIKLDQTQVDATTVGGWVVEELGKVPAISTTIDYQGWNITILEADEKKVIKLNFIKQIDASEPQAS